MIFRKGKGQYIPFGKLPNPIEPTRLEELVTRLREGDETVKEEIIYGHLALSVSIACRYGKEQELISGAFYGVVYAVNRAGQKLTDNNITAYISSCVHRFVHEEWMNLRMRLMSDSCIRKNKDKDLIKVLFTTKFEPSIKSIKITPIELNEFKEKQSELVKQVLELRMHGYKNKEIAQILNTSESEISRLRQQLKVAYKGHFG